MVRERIGNRNPENRKAAVSSGATIGFEAELWGMAEALRGSMDAAEYKLAVLGLIFLKYISDVFEENRDEALADWGEEAAEDRDEYIAENMFWVPAEARWELLRSSATQPTIGRILDEAMIAIERDNSGLKGVLPKEYARPVLDQHRLGDIINLVSNMKFGNGNARSRKVVGRVYEYFLSQFANAEGKKGDEFYTPKSVAQLLVEMLKPWRGRVYDPCCGSAGMFVQSMEFIHSHATGNESVSRQKADLSIFGQESNYTTWRIAKMNLAIRGIDAQIKYGNTIREDLHPDLKADYILANPPFNVSDWGGERLIDDKRWKFGVPPKGNANYAWIQHIVHHLSPRGTAGFVLANGSMTSGQSDEKEIRKNLIEANLVDCMVALPGQLFHSTQIPACLWFLARSRSLRNRSNRPENEILFIDARSLGQMVARTHRELTDDEIEKISVKYHAWRCTSKKYPYSDELGFCKSTSLDEVRKHGYALTPGRYVGLAPQEAERGPFNEKMRRLTKQLRKQQMEARSLDQDISANLMALGFGDIEIE